jgi:4-amino-4-deoxy-L-arabinose transferase-like glycosyltransferase
MTPLKVILSRFLQNEKMVFVVVLLSFFYRTAYAVLIADQMSGQDADTYSKAAQLILSDGPFASGTGAPYYAIGYPWFISVIWKIFSVNDHAVGVVQNLLLAFAILAFYKTVENYFSRQIAFITLTILVINPALTANVSLIAYETPMMSFLMLGFFFLTKAFYSSNQSTNFLRNLMFAGIYFTCAITLQPKILPSIIFVIIFLFSRKKLHKDIVRKWTGLILVFAVLSLGPIAAINRNVQAGDGFGYTANFYANVELGARNSNVEFDFSKCPASNFDSFGKTLCILNAKLHSPSGTFKSALHNGTYFWTPYVGNLKWMGTWFHGADLRRLVPSYTWYDKNSIWFSVDRITGYLWTLLILSMILFGMKRALSSFRGLESLFLFAVPVLLLWSVSLVSYGESRYRLPILPFYTVFIAVATDSFLKWVSERRHSVKNE